MCLGVPGKVIEWLDRDPLFARAMVEFEGIGRECQMACVPQAEVGEYVIVHAGIAISRVNAEEASKVLEELRAIGFDQTDVDTDAAEAPQSPEQDSQAIRPTAIREILTGTKREQR